MADSPLDADIDTLYRLPLDEFVRARQALASRSSRDEARIVRALPKPNIVAWALNQLYWSAQPVFDRLVEAAARLRDAQAKALLRRPNDVAGADAQHRRALGEATREAAGILRAAGHDASPDSLRAITAALEALPWKERAGRLARPPVLPGFGVFAGLRVAEPPPAAAPAAKMPVSPAPPAPPPVRRPSAVPPSKSFEARSAPRHLRPQDLVLSENNRPHATGSNVAGIASRSTKPSAEELERERRERQANEAAVAAREQASATAERLAASRERLALAQEEERAARERVRKAEKALQEARDGHREAEREDAAARAALRKAEAAAAPRGRKPPRGRIRRA